MMKALFERFRQGYRTMPYPAKEPTLPDRLRGLPRIDASKCPEGCRACAEACPTDAIRISESGVELDLGLCLYCPECVSACPTGAIEFSTEYRLSARRREDLLTGGGKAFRLAEALDAKTKRLFGRSLKLRQVSAGGCNGCEADVNVLGTLSYDLGRFGIQMVASPRHADGLLITGPIPETMALAVKKTYDAVPSPKLVIAVGACAISGGPYIGNPEVRNGATALLPVDLFIPGCPPHPMTILDGLLRLLGRLEKQTGRRTAPTGK